MNIIIAGDGKVGKSLTSRLSAEGHDITIIDKNADVLETSIEQYDVMSVVGNCASMEVLKEAGIDSADLLITTTNYDEVNLLCCMTAHHINPSIHTIARVRNVEFDNTMDEMKEEFALSLSVNPDKKAASEIRHILRYPGFLRRDRFAKGVVQIVELKIDGKSKLINQPLLKMEQLTKCKTLVCAVLRDGEAIIPKGDFIFKENDHIFLTADGQSMTSLLVNLGIITKKIKNVLIVGGSRIAYYLTEKLLADGVHVKIIEKDYNRCVELADGLFDATIIHADGSDKDVLIKQGIEDYDALVALTGVDELNILLGLYGESIHMGKVVTKLGRAENFAILSELQTGTIIDPKQLVSNTIVRYVRAMNNQKGAAVSVHTIANGKVEAIEFIVDADTKYTGVPLSRIRLKENVLIACITKGNRIEYPSGNSTFAIGDRMIVVTNGTQIIDQINDIFR